MMPKLRTISPICVSIVTAILHFLSCVEGMSSTEREYLKDVEHALREIFGISDSHLHSQPPYMSLLNIFTPHHFITTTTSSHPPPNSSDFSLSAAGPAMNIDLSTAPLFHEFFVKLTLYRFFDSIFGEDYNARRIRSKNIFKAALKWLIQAGIHPFNLHTLAHALQNLGHKAFKLKLYCTSAEFYTCAIALFNDNVGFLCDRAWALMMIERYQEALNDCYRAIQLEPNYARAYMVIGCIYLDQGNIIHAISHGFIKVLQLDPQNADGLKHLELALDRLKQQLEWKDEQQKEEMLEGGGPSKRQKVEEKEEFGDAITDGVIDSVADFTDIFGRYSFPPDHAHANALFM